MKKAIEFKYFLFIGIVIMLAASENVAMATGTTTRTWNGGGGNNNWSTGANWGGTAPVNGNAVAFGGSTRLTPSNDIAANTTFVGITFNSGSGAFTLGGNAITLGGNVTNNDNDLQTINMNLILSNDRNFNLNSGNIQVGGIISESGGAQNITISGSNALIFTNPGNTYTGTTVISSGELRLNPITTPATFTSQIYLDGGTLSTTNIASNTVLTSSSTLDLNSNSTIALGSNLHSLKFAASNGITWTTGTTLTITGWTGGYDGTSGSAGKIYFGSTNTGLTSGQLLRINFYNGTNYYTATILNDGEVVPTASIFPQVRYSVASSNWNSTSTWSASSGGASGASVPGINDIAIIERGYTVNISANAACSSLQVGSPGNTNFGAISFSGAYSLTVSGNIMLGGYGNTARTGTITFASGSTVSSSSLTLGNTLATPAAGIINMTSGGTLTTGSITVNTVSGNTWTPGTGTVVMTSNNTLPSTIFTTFNNLTINGGTTTLGVALTSTGIVTISSGATLSTSSNNYSLTFQSDFINNSGTFTAGSSAITIAGTIATQNIAGFTTSGSVSMTKTSGTATLTDNVQGNGWIINSSGGKLNLGSGLSHTANSLTLGGNGTASGTWGGTGSGAAHINSTYFAAATGILTVSTTTCTTPAIALAASATSVCYNNGSQATPLTYSGTTGSPATYSITWNSTPSNSFSPVTDATLPATPISISIPAATAAETYTGILTVKNIGGCLSSDNTFTVTVNPVPAQPGTITGSTTPCEASSQIYSVPDVSGVTFTWVFPSGWNPTTGQGTHSVTVTVGSGSGNITVTPSNGCGNGTAQTLGVTVNLLPSQPSLISGNATSCSGTSQSYSVTDLGVAYTWTFPTGWVQTDGGTTNSVKVTVGSASGTITVTPSNTCGDGTPRSLSVTSITNPAQPSIISGNATVCNGNSETYSVINVSGVTYTWTFPSDWAQTAGDHTYTVDLTVGSSSGDITVTPSNACGNGTLQTLSVTSTTIPGQPGTISGDATPCEASTQTYSVPDVSGVTFTWAFPADWNLTSGQGSHSVNVTVGANSGNITVTPSNSCGNGADQILLATVSPLFSQPSIITGNSTPCIGFSETYSVDNLSGATYTWTFPTGWIKTGGGNSNSVTVTVGSATGDISVAASNGCGAGAPRLLGVAPITIPDQPSTISGSSSVCESTTQVYSVTNIPGVTYAWTFPQDWVPMLGETTHSVTVIAGGISGDITVTPSNQCGEGTSRAFSVTSLLTPDQPGEIIGNTTVCQNTSEAYSVANVPGVTYTWLFPSGWNQTGGGTGSSVTVTVGSGSGNITVIPSNGCGDGTEQTLGVTVNPVPFQPSAITGSLNPCQGSSQIYSVTNVPNVDYTWTFPSGWIQTGGGTTSSVTVTVGNTSGTITVTPSNTCGNGPAQTLSVTRRTAPGTPTPITGNNPVCLGSTQIYSVSNVTGVTYNWTFPAGWTGGGTTNSVTVLIGGSTGPGSITVTPSNACGNGTPRTLNVTTMTIPNQPSTITGNTTVCEGTSQTYSVTNISGVTYNWVFPTGWSQTGGGTTNSVTVTVGSSSGDITVTPSNMCGNGTSRTLSVTTNLLPAQPSIISGTTTVCLGSTQSYSVTDVPGVTYTWVFPAGWTQTGGGTTSSVTVTVGSGSGNITVTPSTCGNGPARTLAVTTITVPAQPGTITGGISVCIGSTQTYSVTDVAGVIYNWVFPTGWTQTGGGNTSLVTVTVGSGSGDITVTPSNTCGDGTVRTLAVTSITVPDQPGTITGSPTPCEASTQTYSVPNVPGVNYIWTFPLGWSQTGGGTTNLVTVTVGSVSGDISVTPSNTCGNGTAQTLTVTVAPLPAQPSVITGNTTVCLGSTQSYSVIDVPGVTYTWVFPAGWIQTGGGTTSSVTATVGSGSGNITVTPSTCGNGTARTLAVSIITVPAQPGTITGGISVCIGSTQTYSVTNVPAVTYTWVFPAGWTQTGGGTTSSVTVTVGSGSGNIIVTPSNTCGDGTARTLTVTSITVPDQPGTITGSLTPCEASSQTYSVPNVPGVNYSWTFPSGWSQTGGGTTNLVTVTVGSVSGDISVTPSNTCGNGTAQILAVTVDPLPAQPSTITGNTTVCLGSTQSYIVTNVPGVTYTWVFPTGWTQTGGGTTSSVTATVGSGSGNITVTPRTCGNGPVRTLSVTTITVPAQPSTITGSTSVCQGASQTYSVTNVAGVTYTWTFPTGWTQTGGGTSNSVTVTVGSGSGAITVIPSNTCGNGTQRTLNVTEGTPAAAGSISGLNIVSQGQTGVNYTVPTITGATSYVWSYSGTGFTITSGSTSNSIIVTFSSSATSGNLTVKGHSSCGDGTVSANFAISVTSTTGSYNFIVPAGVYCIKVEAWGAGGRGSTRTQDGVGGGGGGGAYASSVLSVIPGNSYQVFVGQGSTTTSAGGDSYFINNTTLLAKGGSSAVDNSSTGATGGQASSCFGDTKFSGGAGSDGHTGRTDYGGGGGSSAGNAANGNDATDDNGATAPNGGGNGGDGRYNTEGAGSAGSLPGGGGGGALRTGNSTINGGAGANGRVNITWTGLPSTATPVITGTICAGVTEINGTCTANGAVLEVFVNGITAGTTTVSGGAWTKTGLVGLTGGQTITATAKAIGLCQSTSAPVIVTSLPPTPHISITSGSSSICTTSESDILHSDATTGNQWYRDGSPISGATSQDYTTSTAGNYTAFVTLNGCSSATSNTLAITSITPAIATDAAASGACSGVSSTQISTLAYGVITDSPTTYSITWDSSPVNSFAPVSDANLLGTPIQITVPANTAQGTYTGHITVKNGSCVGEPRSFTLTVNQSLDATFSYLNPSSNTNRFCKYLGTNPYPVINLPAQAGTFSANSTGLKFVSTSTGQIDLAASDPGIYTVTNTVSNGSGCITIATSPVEIIATPDISIHYSASGYCKEISTLQGVFRTSNSDINGSYSATPAGLSINGHNDGSDPDAGKINPSLSQPGTYKVIYTFSVYFTNDACSDTAQTTVSIYAQPSFSLQPSTSSVSYCQAGAQAGVVTPLTVNANPGPGATITDYHWFSNTSASTTGASPVGTNSLSYTPVTTNVGDLYYYCVVTDSHGCSTVSDFSGRVRVNPPITGNTVSGAGTVCSTETPVPLYGSIPNDGDGSVYTYRWESSTDDSNFTPAVGTNNGQDYTTGVLTSTTYFRRVVISGGCTFPSASIQVDVIAGPTQYIVAGPSKICWGEKATITLSGSDPQVTYQLRDNSGNLYGAEVSGDNLAKSFTTTALESTTTFNILATSSQTGCTALMTGTPTVEVVPAITDNTISSIQTAVCPGAAAQRLNGSIPGGGYDNFTYKWQFSTDNFITYSDAPGVNDGQNYFPGVLARDNSWYRRVATSDICASISNIVKLTLGTLPAPVTVNGPTQFCGSATLTADNGGSGIIYYQGTVSGGTNTTLGGSPQTVTTSGKYYFRAWNPASNCWGLEGSITIALTSPPSTVGAVICQGGTGAMVSAATPPCSSPTQSFSKFPGSGANNTGTGTVSWTIPGNITTPGSPYTVSTAIPVNGGITNYLMATNFGFGSLIPSDADIYGVTVTVNRSSSGNSSPYVRDNVVRLIKGGAIVGNNRAKTTTDWPTSLDTASYGGPTDDWAAGLTATDINSSGFGVALSAINTNNVLFPVIKGTNASAESTATPTHHVSLPTGISEGDLLIVFFANGQGVGGYSLPTGWSTLYASSSNRRRVFYKTAGVSEGTSIIITTTNSQGNNISVQSAHNAYCIKAGTFTGNPVFQNNVNTGTSSTPDPSDITPGFTTQNTLWIAASYSGGVTSVLSGPANYNYTPLVQASSGTAGNNSATMATASRQLNADTENPDPFTLSSSVDWGANTIAIQGVTGTRDATVDYIRVTVTAQVNGVLKWFTSSTPFTGELPVYSGSPFNPVNNTEVKKVYPDLKDTQTPNTYIFYSECSSAPGCRTRTDFVIVAQPVAAAGADQSLCNTPTFTMAAVPSVGTGLWTFVGPYGTAVITTPTSATTTVTNVPADQDITLRWTETNSICSDFDDVVIRNDAPTIANAGADQTLCNTPTFTMAAVPSVGTGAWTFVGPSGTAAITTPTSAITTVTNVPQNQNITLRWTETNGTCGSTYDDVVIRNDAQPVANAGADQTLCNTASFTMAAVPSVGAGAWTFAGPSGTAVITTPTSATTTVTNVPTDLSITLHWTETNGTCSSSDDVVIRNDAQPVAAAGPDQSLCNNGSFTLAGNTPVAGVGTWTLRSGSATITTPGSATSGVTDVLTGTPVVLRWTIVNGSCSSFDEVTLTNNDPVTATATPIPAQCGLYTATLTGNNPAAGTGLWTVTAGTGTFTDATVYNTAVSGLSDGDNTFMWTVTNGTCSANASVTIHVDHAVTATTTPIPAQCGLYTATLTGNNPAAGTGLWTVTAGTGTFTDATVYNTAVSGLSDGDNTFMWTVTNGTCSANASVTIHVDHAVTATATPIAAQCGLYTATLTGNNPAVGTGLWTVTAGTGTFTDATVYNTAVIGLSDGDNTFMWTVTNGTCSANASVTIHVDHAVTATATPIPAQCGLYTATLTGNNPAAGTGLWTVTAGTGTFTDATLYNTAVSGLSDGDNTFMWTVTNGTCSANASVTIHVDHAVTATATPIPAQCGLYTATLTGNNPAAGTGLWTVTAGTGTFTDATVYNTAVSGLSDGDNTFMWTVTNGTCSANASVTIHVDHAVTATATPIPAQCGLYAATLTGNNPAAGTGLWTVTAGTGTFTDATVYNTAVSGLSDGDNTFMWTVTNGTCSANASVTIHVDHAVTATATPIPAQCGLYTATLTGNNPAVGTGLWTVTAGTGTFTDATVYNTAVIGLSDGDNTFMWTVTNGTCSANASVTVHVDAAVTVANAGPDQSQCNSSSFTLAGNQAISGVGTWAVVSGTATITNASLYNSGVTGVPANSTAVLSWTIVNGTCSTTDNISLRNDAAATATATPIPAQCGLYTATLTGNNPAAGTGLWTVTAGTGTFTDATVYNTAVSGLSDGDNTFMWTVTNGTCSANASVTIHVDHAVTATATPIPAQCGLYAATLTGNNPAAGTGLWTVTAGTGTFTDATVYNTAVSGLSDGDNTFMWTVTNGTCSANASVTIHVDHAVTATATPIPAQCGLYTATLTGNNPAVGTGLWTVTAGTGTFTDATVYNTAVSGLSDGDNTFMWTVTNGTCSATASVTIHVDHAVTATVTPIPAQCGLYTATLTGNNPAAGTGLWTVTAGTGTFTDATVYNTAVSGLSDGDNTFMWTVTNGTCSANASVTIHVDHAVTATATPIPAQCGLYAATLTGNNPAAGTGLWTVTAGTGTFTDATVYNTAVSGLSDGDNTFMWTVTNGTCSANASVTIHVDHAVTATATPIPAQCGLYTATLTGNNPAVGTGLWTVTAGTGTFTDATVYNTAVIGLSDGDNTFMWTVTNGTCSANASVTIHVDHAVTATATPIPAQCGLYTATLTGNNPAAGTGLWTVTAGTGTFTDATVYNTAVIGLSDGDNTFMWTVTNGTCSATASVTIHVDHAVTATATPIPAQCGLYTATLTGNNPAAGTGLWTVTAGTGTFTYATVYNTAVSGLSDGDNTFMWTVTNGTCSANASVTIHVDHAVTATATPIPAQCGLYTATLTGNNPAAGTGLWTVTAGTGTFTDATVYNTAVSGLSDGDNTFMWTVTNGTCSATASVTIHVDHAVTATVTPIPAQCGLYTATLTGNNPAVGTGLWTVTAGTGTFTDATVYNTAVSGLSDGDNTFMWTVTNGTCSANASVTIHVDHAVTATATPIPAQCGLYAATLTGNNPAAGTGLWTVTAGTGTFTDATVYNTAVSGLSDGDNTFMWTVTNGTCSANASVTIHVDHAVTATATPIAAQCGLYTATLTGNNPAVGTGLWTVTAGTGTFTDATVYNTAVIGLSDGDNTFMWTVTNGTCSANASVTVHVDHAVTATATPIPAQCGLYTATLTGNNPVAGTGLWTVTAGTGTFTDATVYNTAVSGLSDGDNTFMWTVTNGTCSANASVTIHVDHAVTATATPIPAQCGLYTATLTGNNPAVGTGLWTVTAGTGTFTDATVYNTAVIGLSDGDNTFMWTVTNGTCSANASVTVHVDHAVTATATPIPAQCGLYTATLTGNNPVAGTGLWTVTAGTGTFTDATVYNTAVSGLSDGDNTFMWTVTNGTCSANASVTIHVDHAVTATATPIPAQCGLYTATLTGNNPAAGTGLWTVTAGTGTFTDATVYNTAVSGLSDGDNTFMWTVTNGTCSANASVTIHVDHAVTATVTPIPAQCGLYTATLTGNNPAAGTGLWTVTAGTGTFTDATVYNTAVSGLSDGDNTFMWTVTNGTCSANASVTIHVDHAVTATATPIPAQCGLYTATLTGNNPAVGTGLWTVTAGTGTFTDATVYNTAVIGLSDGDNTFMWTVTNGTCSANASVTVHVDHAVTATATPIPAQCGLYTATLTGNNPAVGTGLWTVTAGTGTFTDATVYNTAVIGLSDGDNTFMWTVTNGTCSANASVTVHVDHAVTATATPIPAQCGLYTATLTGNNPAAGTGLWTVTAGTGTFTDATVYNTAVSGLSDGDNTFMWTVTNGTCSANASVTIHVDHAVTATATPIPAQCGLYTATLTGNNPAAGTGLWTVTAGTGTFTDATVYNTAVSGLSDGDNTFMWTVTNGTCSATASVTIHVDHAVTATVTPIPAQCGLYTATLTGNNPAVGTGLWTVTAGTGTFTDATVYNTAVSGLSDGDNTFMWTVTNGTCSANASVTVHVDHAVTATATPIPAQCGLYTATLTGNNPAAGTGLWTVTAGTGTFTDATVYNTAVSGLSDGDNTFMWTVTNGTCSANASVTVHVDAAVTVANAGPDQSQCNSSSFTLAGNQAISGVGTWALISGTATITNASLYNSGVTGVPANSTAVLSWTIVNGTCSTTDNVSLRNDAAVTVANAGPDQSLCNSGSFTLAGNQAISGVGTWAVISGTATITNTSLYNSGVTGVPANSTAVLSWTIVNGTCSTTDNVSLRNDAAVTVANAGPDQTNCNSGIFTLAANQPLSGVGTWIVVSGTATITNASLYNSGVTSVPTGTSAVLRWTIINGTCINFDEVTLTRNATLNIPTAGSNAYTYDGTLKTATASVGVGETIDWYTAATGGSVTTAPSGINAGSYTAWAEARNTITGCVSATRLQVTLTINPRAITITADTKTKVYGDTDPALTYRITTGTLVGTDAISGALTRAPGENVGNYAILQGTLTPGTNYIVTYVGANLTITTRPITITADAKTKLYGTADPALTYQITSGSLAANGDAFSGALRRDPGENVGIYAIRQGTLALNNNYTVTYNGANLTITTMAVTVTANPQTKVYGDTDPALTYTITSGALLGTDSFTGSLRRGAGENVGTYVIGQGTLALNSNYALTFVPANLTITARPVTITADPKTKVYGAPDPVLTYQITSGSLAGNGDAFSGSLTRNPGEDVGTYAILQGTVTLGSNYTLSYNGANLTITTQSITVTADNVSKIYGNPDTLTYRITSGALAPNDSFIGSLAHTGGENVGTYPIIQGTLALSSNYAFTFIGATLTINQRPVEVTADALTKAYGDADPTLTYTITKGSLAFTDQFTGALVRVAGEDVGKYAISQDNLALNSNYILTFVGADFTIAPRAITVTADSKTKTYGQPDPELTYQITSGNLVGNGDSFTGALTRDPGEDVGTYAITQGDLALSANYTLAFNGADFIIKQSADTITVAAVPATKVYGDADPELTYELVSGSLVGTDTFTGSISRQTGENAGTYAITQGTLALSANYVLIFVPADFSITRRPIEVTADAKTKVIGEADPKLTWEITSGQLVSNGDAFSGALTRTAGEGLGKYDITQGTLILNDNYDLSFKGAKLEITKGFVIHAYPNPFTDHIYFEFDLNSDADVLLEVFNNVGIKLATLHSGFLTADHYRFVYEPEHLGGQVIIYRLTINGTTQVIGKAVHMK